MFNYAKNQLVALANNEEGAALVEYGMLVGLIAVFCIGAVTALGTEISDLMQRVADALKVI